MSLYRRFAAAANALFAPSMENVLEIEVARLQRELIDARQVELQATHQRVCLTQRLFHLLQMQQAYAAGFYLVGDPNANFAQPGAENLEAANLAPGTRTKQ